MNMISQGERDIARTFDILGGEKVLRQPVHNSIEAHELLLKGLPASALLHLVGEVALLGAGKALDKAIGISLRTLQRHKKDRADKMLSVELSSRAWKFAEILGRAAEIFGSLEAAEAWMTEPAIGLNRRRPIDLMATSVGIEAVETYLTRIDFGVYA